ncbi:MAG: MinD/ParA family protein [Acetivibrionales bacterium]|jgi:flagellar biosynthesis protein FlhG|nr:MinD/ParA family protein [Clostridiaceae bacterium]
MSDQADMLRKIVSMKAGNQKPELKPKDEKITKKARVITITSGKGGVGKTNITINLALTLSKMGLKVVILDADFGLANIDVLFGIIPKYTLLDLIHEEKTIFEVLTDGPDNIKFLSGGSGVEELIRLDRKKLRKFVNSIELLDKLFDVILIDTGAGLSQNVMNFIMAADEVLLVTTPEPTSITDAYALVKMVSRRDRKKPINIIVNKAENSKEAMEIANKLCMVSDKFLSLKLIKIGYILFDENVTKSVKMQKPFVIYNPKCQASKNITEIAEKLFVDKSTEESLGARGFVSRLLSFFGV